MSKIHGISTQAHSKRNLPQLEELDIPLKEDLVVPEEPIYPVGIKELETTKINWNIEEKKEDDE